MTYISTQSYVSEKGGGKATLEKSLEVQLRGNSSPRGTAGTQTRPWTEIYQDRTSQLMRISTGWREGLAAPVCQPQLILFSFKMWINTNCKENILQILKVTVLRCAGSGINDIISSGSTKQFVRGRRGEGRYSRAGWVEQGLLHERGNSTKATGLYLVASSHGWGWGWIG